MNDTKLVGVPTIMRMAFEGRDIKNLGADFFHRIKENKADANALLDAAHFLILTQQLEEGLALQDLAIQTQQVYEYPRETNAPFIKVLLVLGPGDFIANSPLEFLVEGQNIALDLMYVTLGLGFPKDIPEHDVLMVAVAESAANKPLLVYLTEALRDWPQPVLNRPDQIAELSRTSVFNKLSNLPGIVIPSTIKVERAEIERCVSSAADRCGIEVYLSGDSYPLIIRPIDSHAGKGLEKIESEAELKAYLETSTEARFYVSKFVDYTSDDGQFRKYRLILIGGRPHVCHMAISARWMVHYLNSDMLKRADYRQEEQACMENFDSTLARRHQPALAAINSAFGLDYVGIDCAETKDGQLLIFEVDSNMLVHNNDSAELFPYKKIQMPKIFKAFSRLLESKKLG